MGNQQGIIEMTTNAEQPVHDRNIAKRLVSWAMVIAAVLLLPFATHAPWTGSDYVFAGIVLSVLAVLYELITKNMTQRRHRIFAGLGVLLIIFLIMGWAATGP
ncbi:MAG TPA: hypothetical protein VF572_04390 [Candidatus Saccharimonadales bacterium]|jgi:uncharacterized membrane protein YfhO